MSDEKIYVGDVGTEFIVDTGESLSGVTSVALKVLKPDGTEVTWTGEVYNNTCIKYVIKSNDLDQAGLWRLQAYVESSEWTGRGETVEFRVYEKYT